MGTHAHWSYDISSDNYALLQKQTHLWDELKHAKWIEKHQNNFTKNTCYKETDYTAILDQYLDNQTLSLGMNTECQNIKEWYWM
jgi:hypothetical protein